MAVQHIFRPNPTAAIIGGTLCVGLIGVGLIGVIGIIDAAFLGVILIPPGAIGLAAFISLAKMEVIVTELGIAKTTHHLLGGFSTTWDNIAAWSIGVSDQEETAGARTVRLQLEDRIVEVNSINVGESHFDEFVALVERYAPVKRAREK